MTRSACYVFAGGGSGGHLEPSLGVAERLLSDDPDCHVVFLTSRRHIDRKILSTADFCRGSRCCVVPLPLTGRPGLRPSSLKNLAGMLMSVRIATRLLRDRRPRAIMATGGFAAVPPLLAARRLQIPVLLFEANVQPGRVNRWFAPWAAARLTAWSSHGQTSSADSADSLPVGMPLRTRQEETLCQEQNRQQAGSTRRILVLGGSQGSLRLNRLVHQALAAVRLPPGWQVLHQTGQPGSQEQRDASAQTSVRIRYTEFITNVPQAMQQSALVVSRAGAVTLAEIAQAGVPAVLVPLSSSAEDHQNRNADHLANHGAARVIDERDPQAAAKLSDTLTDLAENTAARRNMGRAVRAFHRPDAGQTVAGLLRDLASRPDGRVP